MTVADRPDTRAGVEVRQDTPVRGFFVATYLIAYVLWGLVAHAAAERGKSVGDAQAQGGPARSATRRAHP